MAKTNAERQAEYRARVAESGDQRFSTFLPQDISFGLEKLAEYHGLSMRDVVIGLVRTGYSKQFGKPVAKAYEAHLNQLSLDI